MIESLKPSYPKLVETTEGHPVVELKPFIDALVELSTQIHMIPVDY